jgi:preprotein translocase subunit SecD
MLHFERWKIIAILLTVATGILFALPNFVSKERLASWPDFLPKRQMPLGLDLRGGAHLLLALDQNEIRKDWLQGVQDAARANLREAKIGFSGIGIDGNSVKVTLVKPEDAARAETELKKLISPIGNALLGTGGNDLEVAKVAPNQFTITPTAQGFDQRLTNATTAGHLGIDGRPPRHRPHPCPVPRPQ